MWINPYEMSNWALQQCVNGKNTIEMFNLITTIPELHQ